MDAWPPTTTRNPTQSGKNRRGNVKATLLPYPLLEGGALTSATLREHGGRFEWVTAQNRTSRRKLACSEKAVLAFPPMRSPQLHPRTTSWSQRAEQGAHFLRSYYPDVDVPAELIREQIGIEAQLEDSLGAFDPLIGDLVTSFYVYDAQNKPWGFMAFPMGQSGCDLNFSSVEFSAEGNIIIEPSHYPTKEFETPICQIVSSAVSSGLSKGTSIYFDREALSRRAETVVGVRTFSSTSLLSLSLPTSKQSRKTGSIESKEIGLISSSNLNGHIAVDVQIHNSLEYAAIVSDQGHIFRHTLLGDDKPVKVFGGVSETDNSDVDFWRIGLGEHKETCLLMSSKSVQLIDFRVAKCCTKVHSVGWAPDLLTSIECDPDNGLSRLVTTNELIWVDHRFQCRPIVAWKHEREYDRTLKARSVGTGGTKLTILSSRNNSLLSVYDVSRNNGGLLQSHAWPYSLSGSFPHGHHAGFYTVHPHPESGNIATASLLQLTSRGGMYQAALSLRQDEDITSPPVTLDVSWSAGVHRLAAASDMRRPDVGKMGGRAVQEVDFRQAYQRLFSPLDAAEAVYPTENPRAVYQTLDMMPLFWQEASTAHEHMLTTFDIAFRSGEEPIHASRADFLTRSTLSSRRGFRALTQGRVPQEALINGAAWYVNIAPVLGRFVPDISEDVHTIAKRLRRYDLVLDDCRSGSSLRRESESREQLAVDLLLSTDVYSAQPFAKVETELTEDDEFETMSRAAGAMTLETELPTVHFGYLTPVPRVNHDNAPNIANDAPTGVMLPPGVRLLLSEWETGTDPDRYTFHNPYDDQQPVASSPILHTPSRKRDGRDGAQVTESQPIRTAPPPVIRHSQAASTAVISSSQPVTRRLAGSQEASGYAGPDIHPDSYTLMASTQPVPGAFGGRLPTVKMKAAPGKKRVGGF